MKSILVVFTCIAVAANAQPGKLVKPVAKPIAKVVSPLKNGVDSLSYAMGVIDASFLKQNGVTRINQALMSKGSADVMANKPLLMDANTANNILNMALQKAAQKAIQPRIDAGRKFLANNIKQPGWQATSSGLQYFVVTMGTGPKPVDGQNVEVHYEGTLIEGAATEFDNSRKRGQPAVFNVNGVVAGWTEVLKLMPVGSRFKVALPYEIGYGIQGNPNGGIGGGEVLLFDMELLSIK
jgi:FKBP-type peptidyl-prolyl cis-trans isomerase FklB